MWQRSTLEWCQALGANLGQILYISARDNIVWSITDIEVCWTRDWRYSITSSALTRSFSGSWNPNALAAFRLITR